MKLRELVNVVNHVNRIEVRRPLGGEEQVTVLKEVQMNLVDMLNEPKYNVLANRNVIKVSAYSTRAIIILVD